MTGPTLPPIPEADEPAPRAPWRPVETAPPEGVGIPALLAGAAAALDGYDELARRALRAAGEPTADQDDDEVQRFLRALAAFFAERPALSALAAGKLGL